MSLAVAAIKIAALRSLKGRTSAGDGDDLVRFVRHLDLAEHQALMRRKGRDHMDRRLGVRLSAGAA